MRLLGRTCLHAVGDIGNFTRIDDLKLVWKFIINDCWKVMIAMIVNETTGSTFIR